MKNFQVMIFNAVVLIALGIYGYTIPPHSPTALISVGIGAILIILSFPVKSEKSVAAHIAVGLTGLSFIMFLIVGILRMNSIIILMAIITLLALVFYISDFIRRKAEREKSEQK
jgi:Ca2+/Na+ antiporter